MSGVVHLDPQGTMAAVLRPPNNFEGLYAGVAASTPILLVPRTTQQQFRALDVGARRPELDDHFVNMLSVGRNSTLWLWLPRLWTQDSVQTPAVTTDYEYQLVWRLRQLRDRTEDDKQFSLADQRGTVDTSSGTAVKRMFIPCAQGPIIRPTIVGTDELPLVGIGQTGTLSQGVYDPGNFTTTPTAARGTTYYPPEAVHVRGDEVGLLVRRVNQGLGAWNFATHDAAFSNFFGTNLSEPADLHPERYYAGVLAFLTTVSP